MAESEAAGGGDDDALVRSAKTLPLEARLTHANWRVRVDAYADVTQEVGSAENADAPSLKEFGARLLPSMRKQLRAKTPRSLFGADRGACPLSRRRRRQGDGGRQPQRAGRRPGRAERLPAESGRRVCQPVRRTLRAHPNIRA
jgi:hypothetical protein